MFDKIWTGVIPVRDDAFDDAAHEAKSRLTAEAMAAGLTGEQIEAAEFGVCAYWPKEYGERSGWAGFTVYELKVTVAP